MLALSQQEQFDPNTAELYEFKRLGNPASYEYVRFTFILLHITSSRHVDRLLQLHSIMLALCNSPHSDYFSGQQEHQNWPLDATKSSSNVLEAIVQKWGSYTPFDLSVSYISNVACGPEWWSRRRRTLEVGCPIKAVDKHLMPWLLPPSWEFHLSAWSIHKISQGFGLCTVTNSATVATVHGVSAYRRVPRYRQVFLWCVPIDPQVPPCPIHRLSSSNPVSNQG